MRQDGRARRATVAAALVVAAAPALAMQNPPGGPGPAPGEAAGRGELIFHIGGCANCHTAPGGPQLAGGGPLKTPYGTFYAPNITPDPETGIGGWTEEQFTAAVREGVAPDGGTYYPAFPYTSYTLMTDEDVRALKAYLDAVPPVRQQSRQHELSFPYDQRWALRFWKLAFHESGRFEPDPSKDEAWNRGAYLVLGPGHCAQCHTPRNFAGALDESRAFEGGPAPAGQGRIPNITSAEGGIGAWSVDEIATALTLGLTPDGDFLAGEMGNVVANATSKLPPPDLRAIAVYVDGLPPKP